MKKISISTIAWRPEEDPAVLNILKNLNIKDIDTSPYKFWPDLLNVEDIKLSYPDSLRKNNFKIRALQSLLYKQPQLTIFTSQDSRQATARYLKKIIDLAAQLRIEALIFGSPKNKLIGSMKPSEARGRAVDFFSELADYAADKQIYFCLEPTPREYGADFMMTHQEVLKIVGLVDSPGLKLNLDLGVAKMNQENCEKLVTDNFSLIGHIHISEPFLKPIVPDSNFHAGIARVLSDWGYVRGISVEQLADASSNLKVIRDSLAFVKEIYGKK